MQSIETSEAENKPNLEDFAEFKAEDCLSAKELQKIRHERRRDNIRKNSKTKSHFNSADIWSASWGFDWAG